MQQHRRGPRPDRTRAVVDAAIEEGITLFDTAEAYGEPAGASEELLGHRAGAPA
ncbi:aldo/keto reductase [Nonomuraea wenchangensis]|uniref:aldo/keto reductase n=1 Tax=Nonomuraea wenchangensis TaxID=568860 RepID=UPI003717B7E3